MLPQILAGLQSLRFLRRHGDDGQGEDVAARFDQIHHLLVSGPFDIDVVSANRDVRYYLSRGYVSHRDLKATRTSIAIAAHRRNSTARDSRSTRIAARSCNTSTYFTPALLSAPIARWSRA